MNSIQATKSKHKRFWLAWSCLAFLIACQPDLNHPDGIVVTCASDRDCPELFRCEERIQRCIERGTAYEPLAMLRPNVVPQAAKAGATVQIEFDLIGQPSTPPVVEILTPDARRGAAFVHQEGARFTFAYTPTGNEAEGSWPVVMHAQDRFALALRDEPLGSVAFDFSPPHALLLETGLVLTPPAAALASHPLLATVGTTITVSFLASEPLFEIPQVWVEAPTRQDFDLTLAAGDLFTFSWVLPAGTSLDQGEHEVWVRLVDVAANESEELLPSSFIIDTESPEAPSEVTLVRRPWGSISDPQGTWLRGVQLNDGEVLIAWDAFGLTELGRAMSDAQELSLGTTERAEVRVSRLDAAGNASPRVLVREGTWTASLGGKQRERTFENPHALLVAERRVMHPTSSWLSEPTNALLETLTSIDGLGLHAFASSDFWRRPQVQTDALRPAMGSSLAYDEANEVAVAFGGANPEARDNVHLWDGHSWREARRQGQWPAPRTGHMAVYDVARERTLMFGGTDFFDFDMRDTWEWDGQRWHMVAQGSDVTPPARVGAAFVYDRARRVTLMVGGISITSIFPTIEAALLDDMWEWDGTSWSPVAAGAPGGMVPAGAAYDAIRQQAVFFGGQSSLESAPSDDTWVWDGAVWHHFAAATEWPAPRMRTGMAFDQSLGAVVLLGGMGCEPRCDELWAWHGTGWSLVNDAGPQSDEPKLVFDAGRQELLLLSHTGPEWLWTFESSRGWRMWAGSQMAPPPRRFAALAASELAGGTLLFGGFSELGDPCTSGAYCKDTWGWNGFSWQLASGDEPPARLSSLLVGMADGQVLLWGGLEETSQDADTWLWGLAGDGPCPACWQDVSASAAPPPPWREYAAAAFDAARDEVILFGGVNGTLHDDTWRFGRTDECPTAQPCWQKLAVAGPPARARHVMAYDAIRDRIVLFGGAAPEARCDNDEPSCERHVWDGCHCADVWEWNGAEWQEVIPAASPMQPKTRTRPSMVFDPQRGLSVLFGGQLAEGRWDGRLWGWDGGQWWPLSDNLAPPFHNQQLVFDAARDAYVVYGNRNGHAPYAVELWEYMLEPEQRPSIVFAVDCGAGPPPAGVQAVRIEVSGGARGYTREEGVGSRRGQSVEGLMLSIWDPLVGTWEPITEGPDLSPEAPGQLVYEEGIADWSRYVVPLQQRAYLRIEPRAGFGSGWEHPVLFLDAIELTLTYRLSD